ncbi:LuxR C-terminal-related transcriptional regulator [Pelagicoccus enzymogenes]|uniref:LuxR C-terminal-related transcriptional regulator n=1 Tax=Pelagicoccus enzymogenes TaxID=2773457 RepID=UPI00280EBE2D|nr:LuxR C-terminal-related transcriptional regulator [Pelagicoccus enzymogenes]MDQ8198742.1 LuxR C-terminal-related transcriptional regulator [Pelagicoccus enzymogenes]
MGAISVQLEMVRTDSHNLGETTQKHIQTAHKLARTALADARDSIWNMRSQVLEKYDLSLALERIAKQLTGDTDIEIAADVVGKRRRLPPVVENNLLRIGQEALTNACKHANSKTINVRISYQNRRLELLVSDDGIGFDIESLSPESKKSFGLVGMGGAEAIMAIRKLHPEAKIIVISTYDWDEDIHRALQSGAASYILKDMPIEDIAEIVRSVFEGGSSLPPPVAKRLAEHSEREQITEREREVLATLVKGRSNKEIAVSLSISDETVKSHLKRRSSKS